MPAYCYFDILAISDDVIMQEYREKVMSTVEKYKGKYNIIGGPCSVKEGEYQPAFPVMIEFPDMKLAEAWYNSEEYKPLLTLRKKATRTNAVFFQSFPN